MLYYIDKFFFNLYSNYFFISFSFFKFLKKNKKRKRNKKISVFINYDLENKINDNLFYFVFIYSKFLYFFLNFYSLKGKNNINKRKIFFNRILIAARDDIFDDSVINSLKKKYNFFFKNFKDKKSIHSFFYFFIFYFFKKNKKIINIFFLSLKDFFNYDFEIKSLQKGLGQRNKYRVLDDDQIYFKAEYFGFLDEIFKKKNLFRIIKENNRKINFSIIFFNYPKIIKNIINFFFIFFFNFEINMYINNINLFLNFFNLKKFKNKEKSLLFIFFFKNPLDIYLKKILILFYNIKIFFKYFEYKYEDCFSYIFLFLKLKNYILGKYIKKFQKIKVLHIICFLYPVNFVELRYMHLTDYKIRYLATFNKSYDTFKNLIKIKKRYFLFLFKNLNLNFFLKYNKKNLIKLNQKLEFFFNFKKIKKKKLIFFNFIFKYNNIVSLLNFNFFLNKKKLNKKKFKKELFFNIFILKDIKKKILKNKIKLVINFNLFNFYNYSFGCYSFDDFIFTFIF